MSKKLASLQLGSAMLQGSREPSVAPVSALPVNEMPMVLTLDQMGPHPDNPRTKRNPKYDDIKESIRHRGLDTVLKVTRDPNVPDIYVFSDGGNTRYQILSELWHETGEESFFRHTVIFKPWPGRLQCVIGHLAENEVRGELTFIEKAFGVQKARSIYEEQLGKSVSLRELATLLTEAGLPIDNSLISRMDNTIAFLYPYIPNLLESGLGRPQVQSLLSLRHDAEKIWSEYALTVSPERSFEDVFGESCKKFDSPDDWSLEMFRDEFIGDLVNGLPHPSLNYDRWVMELDPKVRNQRKLFGDTGPLPAFVNASLPGTENKDAGKEDETPSSFTPSLERRDNDAGNRHSAPASPPVLPPSNSVPGESHQYANDESGHEGEHNDENGSEAENDWMSLHSGNDSTFSDSTSDGGNSQTSAPLSSGDASSVSLASSTPALSFAHGGLEPVTDIWQISAFQDDIEHLQDSAYRLAFELAEAMGHPDEIQEAKGPHEAGYVAPMSSKAPFILFLNGLAGQQNSEPFNMFSFCLNVIGSANKGDTPVLTDTYVVKTLRLIRVLRRLREHQRQLAMTVIEQ